MRDKRKIISFFLICVMSLSGCGGEAGAVAVEITETVQESDDVQAASEVTENAQVDSSVKEEPEEQDMEETAEEETEEVEEEVELVAWDPKAEGVSDSGASIIFGSYEQDNDLSNGAEPIEWRILKHEDGKLLLISRYGLDAKVYNETDGDTWWNSCTLRSWLNGDFYNTAFNETERGAIQLNTTETEDNLQAAPATSGGYSISDFVFLLSGEEYTGYINFDRRTEITEYARSQGATVDTDGYARAWLRSPGGTQNAAQVVKPDGVVDPLGDYNYIVANAVRPAIWVTVTPDISEQMIAVEGIQTGSYIKLGHYEQNSLWEGAEPIEWLVLTVRDDKALLVSRYVLDTCTYDGHDWGKSYLREWLNNNFYNAAFGDEKDYIVYTKIDTPADDYYFTDDGGTTNDYIFVLSYEEAVSYFAGHINQFRDKGMALDSGSTVAAWSGQRCAWWLRNTLFNDSQGTLHGRCAMYADYEIEYMPTDKSTGVRPAMWVDLSVLDSGLIATDEEAGLGGIDSVLHKVESEVYENIVTFGSYEQDNDRENGAEPIEWMVLKEEDGKMLLLSKYGLDMKPYHDDEEARNVRWDTCSLRGWLNNDFYNTAFGEEEKKYIALSEVTVDKVFISSTSTTLEEKVVEDYVFLLSKQEVNDYVPRNNQDCEGTPYLTAQPEFDTGWLTRDARSSYPFASMIGSGRNRSSHDTGYHAVRPAIWVTVDE